MPTEVYSPVPLNPDTAKQHLVIDSEGTPQDSFLNEAMDNQSEDSPLVKRNRREVVEAISPGNVHLYGSATLDKVLMARELIHSVEFGAHTQDERDEMIAEQLDNIMVGDDEDSAIYMTHRLKLGDMLMQTSEKFKKTQRRKEVDQARRNSVKLRKPSREADENFESFTQRIKGLFERESDESHENSKPEFTVAKLDKEIKRLDRRNDGLVGKIAATETKVSFLESRLDTFNDQIEAHGANVNDRTRRSVERETIGKLVDTKGLADAKGLEGDERRAYITELIDTFHGYAQLSDEDRQDLHEALGVRYRAAKERAILQTETDNAPEKVSSVSHLKRSLGALATKALDISAKRWELRKENSGEESDEQFGEQLALFEEDSLQTDAKTNSSQIDKLKSTYLRASYGTGRLFNKARQELSKKSAERQGRKPGETNTQYEKRMRRNGVAAWVGLVAFAAIATASRLNEFDNVFGIGVDGAGSADKTPSDVSHGNSGGLGDLLQVPDAGSPDKQDIVSGIEINPQDGGQEGLTRAELFDGSRGTRSLTTENAQHLSTFLDSYKVKDGDNRGVWGISEKYLQSQGVKNPTVFETDAVKDYILKHSALTNSTIIHPGDTIRLK